MPPKTPDHLSIVAESIEWSDIQAQDGEKKLRRFKMVAYTGVPMHIVGWYHPVVVDLATLKAMSQVRIFKDHRQDQLLGHAENVEIADRRIRAEGVLTNESSPHVLEVSETSRNGTKWQASIGVKATKAPEFVGEGSKTIVNGRTIHGPAYIMRSGLLHEVSFVLYGADGSTSASVAALRKESPMDPFEKWLQARAEKEGFDPAELTAANKAALKIVYEAEVKAQADADAAPKKTDEPPAPAPVKATATSQPDADDGVAELRAARAAEMQRIAAIEKACEKHPDIAAKAIGEGWTTEKAELEVVRASRPTPPDVLALSQPDVDGKLLECAAVLSCAPGMAEKQYGAEACQKVVDARMADMGLGELLLIAARANGYTGRNARNVKAVLAHAFGSGLQASGFSTVDISGILSNVANKFLLEGFNSVEDTWRKVAGIRPVRDFKQTTGYRLVAGEMYEKVGADGELKHGALEELSYTNKADTYGRMFGITRQDIINDDLDALSVLPRKVGRAGGLKVNDVFWTEFLNHSAFFASGNNNLITTALGSTGLKNAIVKFRKQTDPKGNPIGLIPRVLLVPPELEEAADELHVSTHVNTGGSATTAKVPNRNVHAGKYVPAVSAYLSNSSYTGYSTTAWFLVADPQDLALIEVVFLNGVEVPTVETADADFNVLGIQMRGYHDFGVSKQEYRAGVKSTGGG